MGGLVVHNLRGVRVDELGTLDWSLVDGTEADAAIAKTPEEASVGTAIFLVSGFGGGETPTGIGDA